MCTTLNIAIAAINFFFFFMEPGEKFEYVHWLNS